MRFFIALEIPDESKQELKRVQAQIKELIPQVRLTDNDKLHLTIAFLGEQPQDITNGLADVLKNSVNKIPEFEITPAYLDGFPSFHQPKIFWIGVKGDIDKLMLLRERVKDKLVGLGLDADERRFIPHIAIAKLDNFFLDSQTEFKLQQIMQQPFLPIVIKSIKLFESILSHGFHSHNTLEEAYLVKYPDDNTWH